MRSNVLSEIKRLDPVKDHQRIAFLSCRVDFPFDTTRALEFALFRTFCVPTISALLDRTKEFECRAQKRYDDTDIIVSEMMEHGYDSERGRAALKRMNQLHERFGWRRMIEAERIALFHFWREVGRRMNIKEIPADYHEFERFNLDYERRHYRYTESNHRVGLATRNLFVSWFPRWMRPLVKHAIHAAMDEPLLEAFGFSKPSRALRQLVEGALKLRARALRFFPRRKCPVLRTEMKHPSYPCGYAIEKVGPPGKE